MIGDISLMYSDGGSNHDYLTLLYVSRSEIARWCYCSPMEVDEMDEITYNTAIFCMSASNKAENRNSTHDAMKAAFDSW